MNIKINENSTVARLAALKMRSAKVAIVFGSTIHLHNTSREEFLNCPDWVCHEIKHVQQYQQHGFVGFLTKYLWEWMKNGYYNNKFEIEARQSEEDLSLLNEVKFY